MSGALAQAGVPILEFRRAGTAAGDSAGPEPSVVSMSAGSNQLEGLSMLLSCPGEMRNP